MYSTASTNVAAWLVMNGFDIAEVKRLQGKMWFYFNEADDLQDVLDEYNRTDILQRFIVAFRQVKAVMK